MTERTLLIIKPDATKRNLIGEIIKRLESSRFRVLQLKMVRLKPEDARRFYAVHEGKPFLEDLVEYMSSGPVVPMMLEREDAIVRLREFVGATDPGKAACGTIRHDFGQDIQCNSVHASDAPETAKTELAFFFGDD